VGVRRLVGSSKASAIDHEVGSPEPNDDEAFVAEVPQPIFPVGDMMSESGEARSRVAVAQLAIVEQRHIAVGVLDEGGKVQATADHARQSRGGAITQGQIHLDQISDQLEVVARGSLLVAAGRPKLPADFASQG
jgi:hypothetical protein